MKKIKKGFTLVELLVVISIIALLLSIMMPALKKARTEAKLVVCRSNLKQLVFCYAMYTADNNNFFESGTNIDVQKDYNTWIDILTPYFGEIDKLRCCPETPAPKNDADAKGYLYGTSKKYWVYRDEYGSYTENLWITNPAVWPSTWAIPTGKKGLWRSNLQKGTSNIPVIADGIWMASLPQEFDKCSKSSDKMDNENSHMQRHCVDRHNGVINVAFMDWSARKVRLKELWKLKWNRVYNTNYREQDWPTWMRNY